MALNVMLVESTSMFEINKLAQLVRMFDMKDLGTTKTNLGNGNTPRREGW
jgi:hypothetical protein